MSRKEKLLIKFRKLAKDFTYNELTTLLNAFGYKEEQGSGSRIKFINFQTKSIISLHKPHPKNVLKNYQMEDVLEELKRKGVI